MKYFPTNEKTNLEKCKQFISKYFHPMQIGTGVLFGSIGVGMTAAGVMYADGINFLFHGAQQIPQQIANGTDLSYSIDYLRESYKGSVSNAFEAGWKQFPFTYCIGHFIGGKMREKISSVFGGNKHG
jgi:hypothetical protein